MTKFNFIPERQLNKEENPGDGVFAVSIFSSGMLCFHNEIVRVWELDGKFVRFYADTQKRSVGWSIVEGSTTMEDVNDAHQLKKTVNGNIVVSVKKILKSLNVEEGKTFSMLPVKNYKSASHPYPIHYIEIPAPEVTGVLNGQKVE